MTFKNSASALVFFPMWSAMVGLLTGFAAAGDFSPESLSGLEPRVVLHTPLPAKGAKKLSAIALDFSADGKFLVAATNDGKLRIWNTERGEVANTIDTGTDKEPLKAAFSADGKSVYVAFHVGGVHVYDVGSGKLTKEFAGENHLVDFSPDGGLVVIKGNDDLKGPLRGCGVFEMPLGRKLCDLNIPEGSGGAHTVSFSADGSLVAIGTMTGGMKHDNPHIFVFSTKDGMVVSAFRHDPIQSGTMLSPDGSLLASFSQMGELKFFDAKKGEPMGLPAVPDAGLCYRLAFSPDGRYLVAGLTSDLKFFETRTGKQVGSILRTHRQWTWAVALSADGSLLAQACGGEIRLWPVGF